MKRLSDLVDHSKTHIEVSHQACRDELRGKIRKRVLRCNTCLQISGVYYVKALVRWATGKRLTNRLPKLSLITPFTSSPTD